MNEELTTPAPAGRLHRIADLFADALEASPADRAALLASADPGLRRELERLLALEPEADSFLNSAPWSLPPDPGPAPELPPGTRLREFTIESLIARGGSGAVYRATQDDPSRAVAIKILATPFPSPAALRRFRQESQTLARLQHPGIAEVLAAGVFQRESATLPYFAMALVQGRPITHAARDLPPFARLELLAQVCEAVEHAHLRGVIHRDLKPANILVGDDGRARVLDFGIAKLTDPDHRVTLTAESLDLIGTIAYMSPEQIRARDLDTRSDIYSLGVVAYEVLTGRLPYPRTPRTIVEAVELIVNGDIERPSRVDPSLRGDLEAVLLAALDKDPTRRHQSAGALASDFLRVIRREHVSVRPLTAAYQARVFVRRHRALVAAAAVGLAVLILGTAATTWQAVRASRAETKAIHRSDELATLSAALLDFTAAVGVQSGSMKARGAILEKILPALDSLAAANPDDVALQRKLAEAYSAMASHLGFVRTANLGRTEDAIAAAKKALAIFDRYGPNRPEDPPGLCLSLAEALANISRFDEADTYYTRARREWLRLAQDQPDNLERLYPAVYSVEWHARALINASREIEAAAIARTTPAILAHVANLTPRDATTARSLSYCFVSAAMALLHADDTEDAAQLFIRARDLARSSVALDPADIINTQGLGDACRHLGKCLSTLERWPEAVDALEESVSCHRKAISGRPGDAPVAAVLVLSLGDLTSAYVGAKRFSEAMQTADESVSRQQSILAADPMNVFALNNGCIQNWGAAGAFRAASVEEGIDSSERTARLTRALQFMDAAIALANRMKPADSERTLHLKQRLAMARAEIEAETR